MITENTQPVFGFIGIVLCSYFLVRLRYWFSLLLFTIGIFTISLGSLADMLSHGHKIIEPKISTSIANLLSGFSEEELDVMG